MDVAWPTLARKLQILQENVVARPTQELQDKSRTSCLQNLAVGKTGCAVSNENLLSVVSAQMNDVQSVFTQLREWLLSLGVCEGLLKTSSVAVTAD